MSSWCLQSREGPSDSVTSAKVWVSPHHQAPAGVLQLNLILTLPTCMLRAQSHKTATPCDANHKTRLSPVLLTNQLCMGGPNDPLLGFH